jgi:hypothetical protein
VGKKKLYEVKVEVLLDSGPKIEYLDEVLWIWFNIL